MIAGQTKAIVCIVEFWRNTRSIATKCDFDVMASVFFFFNDTATTEIYTLSYTTLFRSEGRLGQVEVAEVHHQGPEGAHGLDHLRHARIDRGLQNDLLDLLRRRAGAEGAADVEGDPGGDRKSTRLNSSHSQISYAVFCLK